MAQTMRMRLLLLLALAAQSAAAGASAWSGYRYAPDAIYEVDLASDTDWTLAIDDGPKRPVKVTAGGWNSDQQEPRIPSAEVKDHVIYERKITIPTEARGQAVKILFGGCNYGAEVVLDDQKVCEHYAPMTPFVVDLTGRAQAGATHLLRVKAYTRMHFGSPPNVPVGFDFNQDIPGVLKPYNGHTKFAYGLTGHVRLAVYPPVHITDVFVRPSVANKTLGYEVWITNASLKAQTVELKGALAPWNDRSWKYPTLPKRSLRLEGATAQQVKVDGIPWELGPESYWWPNIPFREDYAARLHWLQLLLEESGKPVHERRQRFGFVEYGEGSHYYTVNGMRFTSFSDSNSYGQVGEYDCWTETPCFQPPQGPFRGCKETWRRYQRIGFNSMRLSTSVPTAYMLETADEAGYMLVPEGGSWGNGTSVFHAENFSRQLQGLIRAVRNHPCIARYSLANESLPAHPESADCPWRRLVDAAIEVDSTRPLVFEVNPGIGSGRVPGMKAGHAWRMEHYEPIAKGGDHLRGMGECAWSTDGLGDFAMQAVKLRLNDWAHLAPWSWVNFWPNFLEGMSQERHPWRFNNYGNRREGVDGWSSPMVQTVRRALDPFLVVDTGLLTMNPVIREDSKSGKVQWPYRVSAYAPGDVIERAIEVFNGALSGASFTLRYAAHWDAPGGPVAVAAQTTDSFQLQPGFHTSHTIRFAAPMPDLPRRSLYLIVESLQEGQVVYREDRIRFNISRLKESATAVFVGADDQTRGDWRGRYGKDGFALAGGSVEMPSALDFTWLSDAEWTWETSTDDKRALEFSEGSPGAKSCRAACRYGEAVSFSLDLGSAPRRLSLYCLDWDNTGRQMEVWLSGTDSGKELARQTVSSFTQGRWLTWTASGRITAEVRRTQRNNAVLSGVFVDPSP